MKCGRGSLPTTWRNITAFSLATYCAHVAFVARHVVTSGIGVQSPPPAGERVDPVVFVELLGLARGVVVDVARVARDGLDRAFEERRAGRVRAGGTPVRRAPWSVGRQRDPRRGHRGGEVRVLPIGRERGRVGCAGGVPAVPAARLSVRLSSIGSLPSSVGRGGARGWCSPRPTTRRRRRAAVERVARRRGRPR